MSVIKSWLAKAFASYFLIIALGLAGAMSGPVQAEGVVIDPALKETLLQRGPSDFSVYLSERPDLSAAADMGWSERGWFVYNALKDAAERSQPPVRQALDRMGLSYRSFWIDNVIIVESGDLRAVEELAQLPGVKAIILPPMGFIPEPEEVVESGGEERAPISSIVQIKAPEVWDLGIRGQGAVVGIIDSGTRHSHVALVNQYRGNTGGGSFNHNFNWFDIGGSTTPLFPNPHGTHVTGTAIGDDGAGNQIGVAPEAQWISCLGCTSQSCPQANLLACGQFMAAPSDLAGNNANPDLRPHVVNNSWGNCDQFYNPWFQGVVDSWVAAGVIPVFANGNASNCGYSSPPGLNTVGNPGRYGSVLGIGSTGNNNGLYAPHSNWGPTDNPNTGTNPLLPDPMGHPELKPNVVAPGVSIFSSLATSDTAFGSSGWTGTSMSAPAASGVLALMVSAAPSLAGDYRTLGTLLMQTANPVPYDSGGPNVGPGNVPNHATGWGEIDALNAVLAAIAAAGPQGFVSGQVTDQATGDPISGAVVFIDNPDPDGVPASWRATTDASGNYSLRVSVGTYDIDYSAFGYLPVLESGVVIEEDETLVINVQLQRAPTFVVGGTVSDSTTGWPLHARIDINGYPDSPIYTDPSDGSYQLELPQGSVFAFTVHALSGGYEPGMRDVSMITVTGGAPVLVENFELNADLLVCTAPGYIDVGGEAFSEDFSAGNGGFTLSGASPAPWQFGTPVTWPAACASGTQCWGTNLTGNYNNSANQTVTSPSIDLSGVTAPVSLRWWQANHIETFTWDQAYVEMSINGGAWQILWQNPGGTVAEPWRELSADISAAAGQSIQLRWRFTSDSSVSFPGLYFDDISVRGAPQCEPQAGALVSGRVTDANTGDAFIGAEVGHASASTLTGVSEDPALGEGAYLLFVPEGAQTLTATFAGYQPASFSDDFADGSARRIDFALDAAQLVGDPALVEVDVVLGQSATSSMDIVNIGNAMANFTASAVSLVRQDFESDFPPADWSVQNLGGTCVWQRNDSWPRNNFAGGQGFSAAADSDACGNGTTMDTVLVSPPVVAGPATSLSFVASFRPLSTSRLDIDVSNDGGGSWTTLQTINTATSPEGPGTPISISLGAYAGDTVQVRFRYVAPGWHWWAQVDQVEILGAADWLSVTPTMGTIDGNSSTTLELSLDAGAASISIPGVYRASILIENDSPYGALVVPVEMTVLLSPTLSELVGQVIGLGYCDADPAPIAGATISVSGQLGNYSAVTDANGNYQLFIEEAESPISVQASAPGHLSQTVGGLVLVGQQTTIEDFALSATLGCTTVDAEELSISLLSGQTGSREIVLSNTGEAAGSFEIGAFQEAGSTINLTLQRPAAGASSVVAGGRSGAGLARAAESRQLSLPVFGGTVNVGVVTPDADVSDLLATLNAFPGINASLFAGDLGSVTGAALSVYDVVVTSNNTQWATVAANVGNALADYIDLGGRVIVNSYTHDWAGWEMAGRFITDGYSPFAGTSSDFNGTSTLGTVHVPDHPIMVGVTAVSNTYLWQNPTLASGAVRIADWSDGNIFVAANDQVVAFNVLPSDGNGVPGWTGDLDLMYFNAVNFLTAANLEPVDWLTFDPASGTVPAGGELTITANFEAMAGMDFGLYEALVILQINDGQGVRRIDLDASMQIVDSDAELSITPVSHDFGSLDIAAPAASQVFTLTNLGVVNELTITGVAVSAAPFAIAANGCNGQTLAGGQSCSVTVSFDPAADGSYSGTLSVTSSSNDVSAGLAGVGTSAPVVGVNPPFGPVNLGVGFAGSTLSASGTLSNTGSAAGQVSCTLDDPAGVFATDPSPLAAIVPPGSSVGFTLFCNLPADAAGLDFSATLSCSVNGEFAGAHQLSCAAESFAIPIDTLQPRILALLALLMLLVGIISVRFFRLS